MQWAFDGNFSDGSLRSRSERRPPYFDRKVLELTRFLKANDSRLVSQTSVFKLVGR